MEGVGVCATVTRCSVGKADLLFPRPFYLFLPFISTAQRLAIDRDA